MEKNLYNSPKEKPVRKFDIMDFGASVLGVIVAIATAWITIDWTNFTWTPNNIMMLSLSGIIAIGGAMSKIKSGKKL